jgi:hypothetical protein
MAVVNSIFEDGCKTADGPSALTVPPKLLALADEVIE